VGIIIKFGPVIVPDDGLCKAFRLICNCNIGPLCNYRTQFVKMVWSLRWVILLCAIIPHHDSAAVVRPVIFMHGLFDKFDEPDFAMKYIPTVSTSYCY